MIGHYIIMASAYSIGKRIVLHYCDNMEAKNVPDDIKYIMETCGYSVPISTHFIQTNSHSFDSIKKLDAFFDDTLLIDTKEEFAKIVIADKELTGLDLAKYIISIVPCTHLKLQKLAYLCYADYLCDENDKLFSDKIYAYRLGPIVESIYKKYKKKFCIKNEEDDKKEYGNNLNKLPSRSRILAAKDGYNKLISINKTLDKYKHYSASELVNLTHKKDSPWNISGSGLEINKVITDDIIRKYHVNESI